MNLLKQTGWHLALLVIDCLQILRKRSSQDERSQVLIGGLSHVPGDDGEQLVMMQLIGRHIILHLYHVPAST